MRGTATNLERVENLKKRLQQARRTVEGRTRTSKAPLRPATQLPPASVTQNVENFGDTPGATTKTPSGTQHIPLHAVEAIARAGEAAGSAEHGDPGKKKKLKIIIPKTTDRVRTRKVPQRCVDEEVLAGLNMILAQVARAKAPATLDDISLLLYTAQTAYQELTHRERSPSPWRASIEAKIARCESEGGRLAEHIANLRNKRRASMGVEVRKILRREGARKWDVNDITRAKVDIEERAAVYRKKIESHERRRSFRRTNDFFEFNRRMFYRRLHEDAMPNGTQSDEEMVTFWSKVWEKQDTQDCFDDLIEGQNILAEQTDEIMNIGKKLVEIVERLPNWKTPGVDKVYNFFIKRCTALHDYLTEIVGETVRYAEGVPRWFYTGITYLIPKTQDPESPADYRPITCMPTLYKLVTKLVARELRDSQETGPRPLRGSRSCHRTRTWAWWSTGAWTCAQWCGAAETLQHGRCRACRRCCGGRRCRCP